MKNTIISADIEEDTIASDMADGSCCTECGQYFKTPKGWENQGIYTHGYPVLCKSCYKISDSDIACADVNTF